MPVKAKIKATAIAAALAMLPTGLFAAGLGKLTVLSGLGQPLSAEIELITSPSDDVSNFTVRLASADAFKDARIEYPSYLTGARFTIERKANRSYIRVTTSQSVNEPFVDMLLELGWPSGKMVKEFTALLDPVDYAAPAISSGSTSVTLPKSGKVNASKQKAPKVRSNANLASDVPVEKVAKKLKAEAPEKTDEPASGDGSYKVKRGDTLAEIASENKAPGVNLDQMLVALYRANPSAFDRQNMNRLKVGSVLKLPSSGDISSISANEAHKEVQAHSSDWQSYKTKLAGMVAEKSEPTESSSAKATGKIAPKVEDKAAPKATGTKDVVKLSQSELGAAAGKDSSKIKNLQKQIDALQDESIAKEKSAKESSARIAELEKMNKQLKELLEMKNAAGAKIEKGAEATVKKNEEVVASKATPEVVASKPAETVASTVESTASQEAIASVEKPKPAKKKVFIAPEPEPETSPMDILLDNLPLVGGGVGAIALLGGLLVWRRRKTTAFADSIITGSDLRANTNIGSTGGAIINTGATENSFLTDFSREGLGAIDTDEVDPIAEAEVYLAYGRDPQAEEILKDALVKDPARQEVRLKLMEIYFNRKDVDNFEVHAKELNALTQGQGANWTKASEMGRMIDPSNSLYGIASGAAAVIASSVSEDVDHLDPFADLMAANAAEPQSEEMMDFHSDVDDVASAPSLEDDALDFGAAVEDTPAPEVDDKVMLDFDLGSFAADVPEVAEVEEEIASADEDGLDMLSFDAIEEPELALPETSEPDLLMEDLGGVEVNLDDELPVLEAEEPTSAEEIKSDDSLLDFDFDLGDALTEDKPNEEPPVLNTAELKEDEAPDFDFSFDGFDEPSVSEGAPETSLESTETSDFDLDSISLDLGESESSEISGFDDVQGDDPVSTKLDLAKAYVEMGDHEGAREILEEVVAEGSSAQQDEARSIISTLS
ncbi:LysM peptidoglycan-binding domain-containing protein [Leeia sp. TBRC 13508]|uniref:LysM peptidoglycan-binding domain-containing protein n=1 Tax=Leeia speluncae TaxID=2884804 RepID=A0ABS8DAL3_9NEIS|nr:FimV/HubP family polar landmark protein [Leeia speluncae]MCB6185251.1 LysM peptidoglycan-binding domain-containing protein [Leeia speluncae]